MASQARAEIAAEASEEAKKALSKNDDSETDDNTKTTTENAYSEFNEENSNKEAKIDIAV